MQVSYVATCPRFLYGKKNVDGLAIAQEINKAAGDQGLSLDKNAVQQLLNDYSFDLTFHFGVELAPHLIAEEADDALMLTHPITGFTKSAAEWIAEANETLSPNVLLEQFHSLLPAAPDESPAP